MTEKKKTTMMNDDDTVRINGLTAKIRARQFFMLSLLVGALPFVFIIQLAKGFLFVVKQEWLSGYGLFKEACAYGKIIITGKCTRRQRRALRNRFSLTEDLND